MTSIAELPAPQSNEVMAAVDLGSNSFHMVVARASHGQVVILDRLREMVRLASGLGPSGSLDAASQNRALDCLRRFGQRLRDMHADKVRVVGTNTLRRARDAEHFLVAAEEALGHPVEIISGMEEARLVYLGVSHHIDSATGTSLVVDIGGGSTELIIGRGYEPLRLESLFMGCVGISNEFFGRGRVSRKRFERARLAVSLELRPIVSSYRRIGWDRAIGSSGTIKTAGSVVHALGLEESGVTVSSLEALIDTMIAARRVEALSLPMLSADRAPVFPGGVAILVEVLRNFGVDRMSVSDGALREGLLYDIVGRLQHEDARERSTRAMQARFHVDEEQAQRVEATAAMLLASVAADWELREESYSQLLQRAALLHEVGLDIAHAKYHQHGGYLLAHADMPGFARVEQALLAVLVGNHRRKLDGLSMVNLPDDWREPLLKLIVLLRLAVLLNRARSPADLPSIGLVGGRNRLELKFPQGWLDANPLTHADLQQEQEHLRARDFELAIGSGKRAKTSRPAD